LRSHRGILAKFSVAAIITKLEEKYGAAPDLDLAAARDANPAYVPPGYVAHNETQMRTLEAFYAVNDPSKLADDEGAPSTSAIIKILEKFSFLELEEKLSAKYGEDAWLAAKASVLAEGAADLDGDLEGDASAGAGAVPYSEQEEQRRAPARSGSTTNPLQQPLMQD
jgi:hypothetical protein